MKKCSNKYCEVLEPEFHKCKPRKDGLQYVCKVCAKKREIAYRKTKKGVVTSMYGHQVERSKKKGWPLPAYSKSELSKRLFREPNFHINFAIWEVDGCRNKLLKPSFDRKDDYKPYSFENLLRICSWRENKERGHRDRKNGINNKRSKAVIQMDLEGNFVKEFYSQRQAGRNTGVFSNSISLVCQGNRKTVGGYKWKYAS